MLQLRQELLDLILIARALHHFENPVLQLKLCRERISRNGMIAVVCEPVGPVYDPDTVKLLQAGVNEQLFSTEEYLTMFQQAGLRVVQSRLDWGFSFKAILERS